MTDLEKIELALRKIAGEAPNSVGEIGYWFARLAEQIIRDEMARKNHAR